jgi:hypothetical protein
VVYDFVQILLKQDYNCSVEFYWSPFLVNLETKSNGARALKLDQLVPMLQRTSSSSTPATGGLTRASSGRKSLQFFSCYIHVAFVS